MVGARWSVLSPPYEWVAKPGQRRETQNLVPQGFAGSNPVPLTRTCREMAEPGGIRTLARGAVDPIKAEFETGFLAISAGQTMIYRLNTPAFLSSDSKHYDSLQ